MVLMNARTLSVLVIILLLGGTAVVLILQRQAHAEVDGELEIARESAQALDRIRSENARLTAALPTPAELRALREDRVALGRLRQEVASLRKAVDALAEPARVVPAVPKVSASDLLRDRRRVSSQQMSNVGWKTPLAAFETLVWAAVQGDIDALAQAVVFDPRWNYQVELLWAGLSPETRAEYRSAERLFAAMTLRDMPLGTTQVNHESQLQPGDHTLPGPGHALVVANFSDANKNSRRVALYFRPSDQGWQLLIPGAAVAKYRDVLKGKSAPAMSK